MFDENFAPLLRQPDPIEMAEADIERPYAVLALLLDKCDRVVTLSRGDGYALPGGKSEPNESPRETVVREIKEELGMSVDVTFLSLGESPFYVGPSYNNKPIQVFAGRLNGRWVPRWDGPEGECRSFPLWDMTPKCPQIFAATMTRILEAWHRSSLTSCS